MDREKEEKEEIIVFGEGDASYVHVIEGVSSLTLVCMSYVVLLALKQNAVWE